MGAGFRAPVADRQALRRLVAEHYPEIATSLLEPLFDVLRGAREVCGGDMDKALIILVVAIRTTEHPQFTTYTRQDLESGAVPVFPSLGTNVRSIADSLGAPRETIRRKVHELIEAGWLVQHGNDIRYTAQGAQQMSDTRSAIEQMAVKNFETVGAVLQRQAGRDRP